MQILRGIVRWIFVCDVIDEVALPAKSEHSSSYATEERAKIRWQDPQKQSNMNFRQSLNTRPGRVIGAARSLLDSLNQLLCCGSGYSFFIAATVGDVSYRCCDEDSGAGTDDYTEYHREDEAAE